MADKAFSMKMEEDFHGMQMKQYLDSMSDKMQRGAVRSMMSKSGTILSKEIRNQLKRLDMPYSRARNAAERKKARKTGQKPLVRTIGKRAWSRRSKGLIGTVVGPKYPEGAHGHLVEFGHRITGHRRSGRLGRLRRGRLARMFGRRRVRGSGSRTVAHGFQEHAGRVAEREMMIAQKHALAAFIRKQGTRAL